MVVARRAWRECIGFFRRSTVLFGLWLVGSSVSMADGDGDVDAECCWGVVDDNEVN